MHDATAEVERFIDDLFGHVVGETGATSTQQVSKHFVLAASGSVQFTTQKDSWLRKIASDTGQWAITTNGLTYINLAALGTGTQMFNGVLAYSNVAVQDNMNVFIPKGSKVTFSVSNSGTQRVSLFFDEALT